MSVSQDASSTAADPAASYFTYGIYVGTKPGALAEVPPTAAARTELLPT